LTKANKIRYSLILNCLTAQADCFRWIFDKTIKQESGKNRPGKNVRAINQRVKSAIESGKKN
jgi:ribosomal 50S subunit-associated protein YjgA (DUF615 family)